MDLGGARPGRKLGIWRGKKPVTIGGTASQRGEPLGKGKFKQSKPGKKSTGGVF